MMKIFYHNDNDGKCAAAIVGKFYKDTPPTHISMQYGMDFPLDDIEKGEKIYILDFSIEPDDMTKLLEITEDVTWVDHHKTAIDKYSEFAWRSAEEDSSGSQWRSEDDISGIRRVGISGCELAWQYFDFVDGGSAPIPEAVKLIGDRDIWAYKYGDRTRNFYYGLKGLYLHPDDNIWLNIFALPNVYVERGKLIRLAFEYEAIDIVRENGFWVDFEGYRCFAANYFRGSEPFEAVEPDADVYLAFSYEGKNQCWTVSLYSTNLDIDVSEIAKKYEWKGKRGGGHKGAAGFQCNYPPFLNLIPPYEPEAQEIEKLMNKIDRLCDETKIDIDEQTKGEPVSDEENTKKLKEAIEELAKKVR